MLYYSFCFPGSCSFSLISCKLMLRQFALINKDYSVRCYDCVIVYNYFKPFSQIVSVGHYGVDAKSEFSFVIPAA